jgi:hypothetical protein
MCLYFLSAVLILSPIVLFSQDSPRSLFSDLKEVERVNRELEDRLPLPYNFNVMGGYLNMPSARMPQTGVVCFGGGRVPPYNNYGVNFQIFSRIELSGNYRVYTSVPEANFGSEGFGDDADRIGNIKIALLKPSDGFSWAPSLSVGADDFIGTKRFHSEYVVLTKEWERFNLELSLGWGKGRMKGLFGGAIWTPLRHQSVLLLNRLSLLAEYDCNNYCDHFWEHGDGREVKSRLNGGIAWITPWGQLSLGTVRGKALAAFASLQYPLGRSEGLFPKLADPVRYDSPIDTEPLGICRPQADFAAHLAYAFADQGLDLYQLSIFFDEKWHKNLWIKVINNRYRKEEVVRERLISLLAALTPSDIESVIVVIEADGVASHSYRFPSPLLQRARQKEIASSEVEILAPMAEPVFPPNPYESILLFQRKKPIWTFSFHPRLLSFFGSAQGKFKYNLGLTASQEGYLGEFYYYLQGAYSLKSSIQNLSATDRINPSQLIQVRTDTIKYYQNEHPALEEAYLQKSWTLPSSWFARLASGYFEPAYGGAAGELLYAQVDRNWAFGFEGAALWKRRYTGLGFTDTIRKLDGKRLTHVPFTGVQYFANFYYYIPSLQMDIRLKGGQFLAKDKGIRLEVGRYFPSGVRFALWYTLTNGHDHVNGSTYHDKGFSFSIPFDLFLRQSSRTLIAYVMSAWLRDVGAIGNTGKSLYSTLSEERFR